MFTGAIFDLDGTLLDSMKVWEKIDNEFLARRGFVCTPEYVQTVTALSFAQAAEFAIAHFGLPESVQELMDEWHRMAVAEYRDNVALKAGAREYLEQLRQQGVKLATATSLSKELAAIVLQKHKLDCLFDAQCFTSEVAFGKTAPDVYLLAAEKLGEKPADCIVFEDILPGLQSAQKAGMQVYAVLDESSRHHHAEMEKIAVATLRDFSAAPLPSGQ